MGTDELTIELSRVNTPGTLRIELKGSILVIHKENWVSKSAIYIPVEAIEITEGKSRNVRKLWEGILGLMIAFLLALPLSLWLKYYPILNITDMIWTLPLSILLITHLVIGIRGIFEFARKKPTVSFTLIHRAHPTKFSFWVKPEIKSSLQYILSRIRELQQRVEVENWAPVRVFPMWFRGKPYRKEVILGLAISFVLFCLLSAYIFIQWSFSGINPYLLWLYLILPFPPLLSVGSEFIRRRFSPRLPARLRKARKAMDKENYTEAIEELKQLVAEQPKLAPARFVLIQLLTEQGDFDTAMEHCEALYSIDPSFTTELKTTIWWLKCIRERMEYPLQNKEQ